MIGQKISEIFKVKLFLPFFLNCNFLRTPLCILIRMGSIRMRIKIPILSKKIIFLPRYFHSFQLLSVIFRYFIYFQIFPVIIGSIRLFPAISGSFWLFSVIIGYFTLFSVICRYIRLFRLFTVILGYFPLFSVIFRYFRVSWFLSKELTV